MDLDRVKSLRLIIGLVASIVWIGAWGVHLDNKRDLALEQLASCVSKPPEGIKDKIKTWAFGEECENKRQAVNDTFGVNMTRVILACVLLFILSHYVAKTLVRAHEINIEKQRIHEEEERVRKWQEETLRREGQETLKRYRGSILKKLGVIDTFLHVLSSPDCPASQEEVDMIKKDIAEEFGKIIIEHTNWKEIMLGNDDILETLKNLEPKVKQHGIKDVSTTRILAALPAEVSRHHA